MLELSGLRLPVDHKEKSLREKAARLLSIPVKDIGEIRILRRSLEARKEEQLSYVYTLALAVRQEERLLKKAAAGKGKARVKHYEPVKYRFPYAAPSGEFLRPVIIGAGPAGLFCAYALAKAGFKPLVLERGKRAEDRKKDVESFWKTGVLNPSSNVQFGEGGAGTFSDGKLNTQVGDKLGRKSEVLHIFTEAGAKESILYDAKPHLGTDALLRIIPAIREKIISFGGEFLFEETCTGLVTENSQLTGILTESGRKLRTGTAVLAVGHSARDTFAMLQEKGVDMEAKAFAVGVRISHPQEMINARQWGRDYPKSLGAASYSLAEKLTDGRGAYSFCMCPGGYVVNASSEEGLLAVNGMSYSGRNSGRANAAIVVTVSPADYTSDPGQADNPLRGVAFQRDLERKAFIAGNGAVPVQSFPAFAENRKEKPSEELVEAAGEAIKGQYRFADVRSVFPEYLAADLTEGIRKMDRKIPGFAGAAAFVCGVESRTSSPVRILRDDTGQSNIKGLFPCGEGAGYAGGIVSAAMDGLKTAEAAAACLTQAALACRDHS